MLGISGCWPRRCRGETRSSCICPTRLQPCAPLPPPSRLRIVPLSRGSATAVVNLTHLGRVLHAGCPHARRLHALPPLLREDRRAAPQLHRSPCRSPSPPRLCAPLPQPPPGPGQNRQWRLRREALDLLPLGQSILRRMDCQSPRTRQHALLARRRRCRYSCGGSLLLGSAQGLRCSEACRPWSPPSAWRRRRPASTPPARPRLGDLLRILRASPTQTPKVAVLQLLVRAETTQPYLSYLPRAARSGQRLIPLAPARRTATILQV